MAATTSVSLRTVFRDRCLNDGDFLQQNRDVCFACDRATTDEECYAAIEHYKRMGHARDSAMLSGRSWNKALFVLAPVSRESRRTTRQERRQERRQKRRHNRACKRNALECHVIPAGSGLHLASTYLGVIQNAEADLRQKP